MAICFASILLLNSPIWMLGGQLLLLLLALTVAATYVSLLNDWTDRTDDAQAGKSNRLAYTSARRVAWLLGTCVVAGVGFGWYFWRTSPLIAGLYLGTWVVFSAYSLPPVRLKGRALAGVLADAAGAHFFPQMTGIMLMSASLHQTLPPLWVGAVGIWSLACGMRNIIWHQLSDATNDAEAGMRTFVTRLGATNARRIVEFIVFPIECIALLVLLSLSSRVAAGLAMLLYAGLVLIRHYRWRMKLTIVQPQPHSHVLLNEYYEAFLPLALLLAAWWQRPAEGLVLVGFGLLFGPTLWRTVRLFGRAAWWVTRRGLPSGQ
ncbi:UbiA family prenyltransferase [Hymenobacter metallilatus]|nr:UbiA family prenyltransferase [Hymenobacter metallilatus]